MADGTPNRSIQGPGAAYTRPPDPESPQHNNLHTSKRQQRDPRAAAAAQGALPRLNLGGGVAILNPVTAAVAQHLDSVQQDLELRNTIIRALAGAIDNCIKAYKGPKEAEIAADLGHRVIVALTGGDQTPSSGNSRNPSGGERAACKAPTWADVARTPKNPAARTAPSKGATSGYILATSTQSKSSAQPRAATPRKDHRIFIETSAEVRMRHHQPFAIRQAICAAINGLELKDVPSASAIKTGWAITPANEGIRQRLLLEENQSLLLAAIDGECIRIPETWVNYAVQGVASSYRTLTGTLTTTTTELVHAEAAGQTGVQPANCRMSRHGANANGITTWIVSFREPVRSFRLFGTSEFSKEIKKRPAIQRHDPGCQGFCNPARCTRVARCNNCGTRSTDHLGPIGDSCQQPTQCANCHGPYKAGHISCPAAPKRVSGRLMKPTKKDLAEVRRAGQRAYRQVHNLANQSSPPSQGERGSQWQGTRHTFDNQDAPVTGTEPVTREEQPAGPTQASSSQVSSSQAAAASGRPQRATARKRNMNLNELSARSLLRNPDHTATSSASAGEDVTMMESSSSEA